MTGFYRVSPKQAAEEKQWVCGRYCRTIGTLPPILTSLLPAASLRMPALRRLRGDQVEGGSTFHDQRLTLVPSQRGHETDPLSVGGVFSVPWSVAVAAHLPE